MTTPESLMPGWSGAEHIASDIFADVGAQAHLLDIFSANAPHTTADPYNGGGADVVHMAGLTGGATAGPYDGTLGGAVVRAAQQALGTPYKWGGTQFGKGVDCSGFVQTAFRLAGMVVPRTAAQQQAMAAPVNATDAQPGDLVFWDIAGTHDRVPGADHVGIYLGNGMTMEASLSNGRVVIRKLWGNYRFGRLAPQPHGRR